MYAHILFCSCCCFVCFCLFRFCLFLFFFFFFFFNSAFMMWILDEVDRRRLGRNFAIPSIVFFHLPKEFDNVLSWSREWHVPFDISSFQFRISVSVKNILSMLVSGSIKSCVLVLNLY